MTATNDTIDANGYYCYVQYHPDNSHQADIGVILLVPSLNYLGACEDRANTIVKAMFSDSISNWADFDREKQAFLNRVVKDKNYFRSVDDLERFSETKDTFTITQPKPCRVQRAPFVVLNDLFDKFMKEKENDIKKASTSTDINGSISI